MRMQNSSRMYLWVLPLLSFSIAVQADDFARGQNASLHMRTLAASCAACHGTNGNSVSITPVLAGLDAHYFVKQMNDFASGARPATVMHRHAKGLKSEEIHQLADFFAAQARTTHKAPAPEKLEAKHD